MTPGITGNGARIDELEARLAHQDQALHELGEEVYRQQQQIVQLESLVRKLVSRLDSAEFDQSASLPADEVPPHY